MIRAVGISREAGLLLGRCTANGGEHRVMLDMQPPSGGFVLKGIYSFSRGLG